MNKCQVRMLKKGDTIGFICPSSRNKQQERMKKIEDIFSSFGYNVQFGKTCYLQHGYLAGNDEERINDIHQMFLDPNIKAIICYKGGCGASRIVDKIDYEMIKKHPKLFMGFSDITVLLNNLYKYSYLPTVHGQVGIFISSPKCDEFSLNEFKTLLTTNTLNRVLKNPYNDAKTLCGGIVEGEMSGGNLCLISDLIGTPYEIDFKDKIVFIEEVDEQPYNIDRMFAQLRLGGYLDEAKGFIFGHFTNCHKDDDEPEVDELIQEYFQNLNKPVIYHFASGHQFPFINLPIGLKVRLDANKQEITILEELYEENNDEEN